MSAVAMTITEVSTPAFRELPYRIAVRRSVPALPARRAANTGPSLLRGVIAAEQNGPVDIARDHIARTCSGAANHANRGVDTCAKIAQRFFARHIHADEIALSHAARICDCVTRVTGNYVTRRECRTTKRIAYVAMQIDRLAAGRTFGEIAARLRWPQ